MLKRLDLERKGNIINCFKIKMKKLKKKKIKFNKKKFGFKIIVIQKKFSKVIKRMSYLQLTCQEQYLNLVIKKSEI